MAGESQHLSEIMLKHNRIANLQVVFTDIEKYSLRRTQAQISVIDALTQCMKKALSLVSKKYIDYSQSRGLNFQSDIISLPTGDGAATVFTFDGLHDIHLSFALKLLESAQSLRDEDTCAKFNEEGWCNCHPYFNLRIGISEGKGIVFKDLREQYNIAGGVVNMAARIMGLGDSNQIMFTQEAYNQIVDMVDDPHFVDLFSEFADIEIKHNAKIKVYQFVDKSLSFLSSDPPEDLTLKKRAKVAMDKMQAAGFPILPNGISPVERTRFVEFMEGMVDTVTQLVKKAKPTITVQAKEIEEDRDNKNCDN
ncbi:MAG: hypothetical protein KAV87_66000 [Desulfobacteraceae bacterium]|nr:hypothetical protein [Desulfobacteraceae bacterium]